MSVLFININPALSMDAEGTLQLLQNSFAIVLESLTKYRGSFLHYFVFYSLISKYVNNFLFSIFPPPPYQFMMDLVLTFQQDYMDLF